MPGHFTRAASLILLAGSTVTAAPPVQHPRTFIVHYDPIVESAGSQRLHNVYNWQDPRAQTNVYIADFESSSHGILRHRITRQIDADVYPVKIDGFRYTDASYASAIANNQFHSPDGVDYNAVIRDYDLARRADFGELDEVHISGAPYFGYWESTMAGPGAYFVNSGPRQRIASSRLFIIMGFNYERGVAEMLHSTGHRSESIMTEVYGGWSTSITPPRHDWDRFGRNFAQAPGQFGLGSVHFPPNADADYDYGNTRLVTSTAPDWLNNFPDFTGTTAQVSRATWGGPDYHRNFLKWWYTHIPHVDGRNTHDGYDRLNNWWEYLFKFNEHAESGGDHLPGGEPPVALPWGGPPAATLGAVPHDDFRPQINDSGRVVWAGFDGNDWEIYSANLDGSGFVQITNNSTDDESPRINAAGRIVWTRFDGQDHEIFSANADGTGVVQITTNTRDDWHPDINDAGRLVWDGFDGSDYEIYSANADGTGLVQITNNATSGDRPREDVWPRINGAGRVVWFGFDGNDWEIYSADATGGAVVQITDNSWDDEHPVINGSGRIAWHTWVTNNRTDIFSANATGGPVTRITETATHDWYPQIAPDGRLVWMGRTGGTGAGFGAWSILTAPSTGGAAQDLTCNDTEEPCAPFTHDQHPQVDSCGRIVWQGFDGHDWEVYALIDGTTYQLTDNGYDDRAVALSPAGMLTWHGESVETQGGRRTQVFALDLSGAACGFSGTDCEAPTPPPMRDPVVVPVQPEFTLPANAGALPSLALAGETLYTLDGANGLRAWDTVMRPATTTLADDAAEIDFGAGANPSSVMAYDPSSGRLLVLANNLTDPDNAPVFPWRDLSAFDPADPGAGFSLITSGDRAGGNIGDHSLSLLSLGGTVHGVHAWLGASFYPALNGDGTSGPTLSGVGNRWAGATTEAHGDGQTGAVMFYLRQTDAAGNPVSTSPLQHESIFRYDFAASGDCGTDKPVSPTGQTLPWQTNCGDGGCVNRHTMEYVPATNRIWVLRGANTNEIGVYDIDDDDWGIVQLTLNGAPLNLTRADLQLVGDRMFILAAGRSAVYSVDAAEDGASAPTCLCEFDDAAGVNVFDLLAYLDLWFAADAGADVDGAPGVDVFDLLAYLDCWFPASAGAPCP